MSENKDPLVSDKQREEGEKLDSALSALGAEKGITIWLTKPDEKGRRILKSNMYNCHGWNDSFGLVESWKDDAHAHRVAQNNHYHMMNFLTGPACGDLLNKLIDRIHKQEG